MLHGWHAVSAWEIEQAVPTSRHTLPSPRRGFAGCPSAPGLPPNHNSGAVTFWPSVTVGVSTHLWDVLHTEFPSEWNHLNYTLAAHCEARGTLQATWGFVRNQLVTSAWFLRSKSRLRDTMPQPALIEPAGQQSRRTGLSLAPHISLPSRRGLLHPGCACEQRVT